MEIQIIITLRYRFNPIKRQRVTNARKYITKSKYSLPVGVQANLYMMEIGIEVSQKN